MESFYGCTKTESFELSWSPDGTRVVGTPEKIAQELATIKESLSHYPLLASLGAELRSYENGTVLDFSNFLNEVRNKVTHHCGNCFSFVLCAMGKNEPGMNDPELEKELQLNYKKGKERKMGPGSVVYYKRNFLTKDALHAYIWISPTLGLERRGTGHLLIRPQKNIREEYKWLASAERKSQKRYSGGIRFPSLSNPLIEEYWAK